MTEQMTSPTGPPDSGATSDGGGGGGKVEAAKDVASQTAGRASDVAGQASEQAKVVARQAKDHVSDLVSRGRQDLGDEASNRSQQAAGSVRTLADRFGALASGDPDGAGPLADLLREGQDKLQTFAGRLDDGPNAVLDDVRSFARRQPVLFLASAGAVGFLVGRLARAGRDQASGSDDQSSAPSTPPPTMASMPSTMPSTPTLSSAAGGTELPAPSIAGEPSLPGTPASGLVP